MIPHEELCRFSAMTAPVNCVVRYARKDPVPWVTSGGELVAAMIIDGLHGSCCAVSEHNPDSASEELLFTHPELGAFVCPDLRMSRDDMGRMSFLRLGGQLH